MNWIPKRHILSTVEQIIYICGKMAGSNPTQKSVDYWNSMPHKQQLEVLDKWKAIIRLIR